MLPRRPVTGNRAAALGIGRHLLGLALLLVTNAAGSAAPPAATPRTPLGLDVSLPAAKRLAGARAFIAVGDWDAAVKSLELLTQEFGDALIEVAPGHAVNARIAAAATMAGLPEAGLSAYRRRVDAAMQDQFDEADARGDPVLMRQLLRDGFASSSGDNALDWLAEEALERGDCDVARTWWTALLPPPAGAAAQPVLDMRYPDAEVAPANVCARLVLCSLLQGDRHRAAAELAAFQLRYGETAGQLAGRSGPLADTLSQLLAESDDWHVGGGPRASGAPRMAGVLWSRTYPFARRGEASVGIEVSRSGSPEWGDVTLSVWQDVVLGADATSVFALDLATGSPRWPAGPDDDAAIDVADLPGADSRFPISGRPRYVGQVADDRYYTRVGSLVSVAAARAPALPPSRLSCFDLTAEGRLAWSCASDEFQTLADGRFSGPPLVYRGRVYVAVRRATPQIEIGLICCDAANGDAVWERRICTALEPPPVTRHRVDHDVLAAGGGLVYLVPGAGLVAACDADTGDIRWAVSYDSPTAPAGGAGGPARTSDVIYDGGRLFANPHDSDTLLALDAAGGRRLWTARLPGRVEQLLGVDSGRLIAAGDQLWGLAVADGAPWRFGFDDPEGFGFGRGALGDGRAYWTTRDELFVVETATGGLLDRVALWDGAGVGGGNLVIAGDRLLIAAPTRLTALGRGAGRHRLSD